MSIFTTKPLKTMPDGGDALAMVTGAGASLANLGPWVELFASAPTALQIAGFMVGTKTVGSSATDVLEIQVGLGSVGNEVSVERLLVVGTGNGLEQVMLPNPMDVIAAGTRVSLRIRSSHGGSLSDSCYLAAMYFEQLDATTKTDRSYNYAPYGQQGATFTPSATPWADSPAGPVELVSGLSVDSQLLGVAPLLMPDGVEWEFDLYIGAAGSETYLTTCRNFQSDQGLGIKNTWLNPGYPVAAGSRISGVLRKSDTDATTVRFHLIYLGEVDVPGPPALVNGGEIDLIWVEITDRDDTVHVISEVDLPDREVYHYGLKLGLLTSVGDLVRKCSGPQGDLYIPSFTFSFFDENGDWRALAADPATRDFKGLFVKVYGITDQGRRAEDPPTVLFRGFTSAHKWISDLRLEFTIEDPLSKELSSTNDAQQIPKRTVPIDDFPGCAETLVTSSAENYVADGAHLAGVTTVLVRDGFGQFAPGDKGTWAGHATVYTISRSSKTNATIQDLLGAETAETEIELDIALTSNIADGEAFTQVANHTVAAAQGTGVPYVYGMISDTKIVGGIDAGDGQGPVKFVGDDVNDGRLTAWFLWSGHKCYGPGGAPFIALNFWNDAVDLSTLAASGERLAVPGYDRFDECAPTGYTAGLSYVTINGRDYTILGLQGVFRDWALGIAPAPPNLGGVPFCVNAYGHEAPTGGLLTSAAQVYKHEWLNYIKGNYQGGTFLTAPLYPDGTSMLNEASFDTLEAQQQIRLTGGYRFDYIVGANNERVSAGERIRRLNVENDCDSFWNQDIAFTVAAVDDDETTAGAGAELLDDINDIMDESGNVLEIDDQDQNLFNVIRFGHTADYLGRQPGGWRSAQTGFNEAYHPASVGDHDKIYAPSVEFHCIRGKNRTDDPDDYQQGSDTVENILAWRLRRTAEAPRIYQIPTGMRAYNAGFELGRVIYISALANVGGRTPRAVRIQGLVGKPGSDAQGRVAVLEAEDQTRIFSDALSIAFGVGAVDVGNASSIPSIGSSSTVSSSSSSTSSGSSGITELTGDVTAGPGSGSQAATIANDAVTNAKAANMAQSTIKGRGVGAGTGDPTDLSATQATAILDAVVGDTGTGGTKGLVPAPAAGDASAGKFLKADGTFAVPSGSGITELTGDVTAGPGSGSQSATLATTGVGAGSYGSSTQVAVFTVDAKGRLTFAGNTTITAGGIGGSTPSFAFFMG